MTLPRIGLAVLYWPHPLTTLPNEVGIHVMNDDRLMKNLYFDINNSYNMPMLLNTHLVSVFFLSLGARLCHSYFLKMYAWVFTASLEYINLYQVDRHPNYLMVSLGLRDFSSKISSLRYSSKNDVIMLLLFQTVFIILKTIPKF